MADQEQKSWAERVQGEPILDWFPFGIAAAIIGIFAVIIIVGPLGLPLSSEQQQAGYRGTGMAQIYEKTAYEAALAEVEAYAEEGIDEAPYEVEEGAVLASEAYENVQVLGHLSEDNFLRVMNAITAWVAPEQGCAYCHGESGEFAPDDYYTKVVARRMIQMTQSINADWSEHVAPAGVTCYTCHRGMNVPQYVWYEQKPEEESLGGWRNNQNYPHPRVASSDLPNNIFEEFLLKDREIRVISQEIRNDGTGQTIKDAEWTFGLMVHMSKGLGVNCAYCHNTRSMGQWDQGPAARTTAWYGIRMVRDLNNAYLAPLKPVYPDFRIGEMGDAPKANCLTCHQGANKPLYGRDMISSWPELAGPGSATTQASMQ